MEIAFVQWLPPRLAKCSDDHIFESFPFFHCAPCWQSFGSSYDVACSVWLSSAKHQHGTAGLRHCLTLYIKPFIRLSVQLADSQHLCLNILRHLLSHSSKPSVSSGNYLAWEGSLLCYKTKTMSQSSDSNS